MSVMKGAEFAVYIWGEGEMHVLVTNSVSNERAEFAVYIWGEGETCFSYK